LTTEIEAKVITEITFSAWPSRITS